MELEEIKNNVRDQKRDQRINQLQSEIGSINNDVNEIKKDLKKISGSLYENMRSQQKHRKNMKWVVCLLSVSVIASTCSFFLTEKKESKVVQLGDEKSPVPIIESIKSESLASPVKIVSGINVLGWDFAEKDADVNNILEKITFTKIIDGRKVVLEKRVGKTEYDVVVKMYDDTQKAFLLRGIDENNDLIRKKGFFYSLDGNLRSIYRLNIFLDTIFFDANFYVGLNGEKLEKANEKKIAEMYNEKNDRIELYVQDEKTNESKIYNFSNPGINSDNYKKVVYNIMKSSEDFQTFKEKYKFKIDM